MSEFSEEKVTETVQETVETVEAPVEEATADQAEAVEEVAAVTGQVEEPSQEEAKLSEAQMSEYDVKMPTPGAIIKGKVVQISNDEVLVDIDYKSEGRIPLNELSFIANANPEDLVSVGERST